MLTRKPQIGELIMGTKEIKSRAGRDVLDRIDHSQLTTGDSVYDQVQKLIQTVKEDLCHEDVTHGSHPHRINESKIRVSTKAVNPRST
jgi:hypothetical protein